MKTARCLAILFALSCLCRCLAQPATAASPPLVTWVCSTEASPWQVSKVSITQPSGTNYEAFLIDDKWPLEFVDGFGGCFNELGWQALQALDAADQTKTLKLLFGKDGCNFVMARAPIGANDFALDWYSLDESPGDYDMAHFSIDRDQRYLIPYMRAAMAIQPSLMVWSVPWCPPSWMKTNSQFQGGSIKEDPATLKAYALYFSKYVLAYRNAGIRVIAVCPQNEPCFNDNVYPQCKWTPQQLNLFIRDYLYPRLKQDVLSHDPKRSRGVQLWLGTLANSAMDYADATLGDPLTRKMVNAVGVQWDGQEVATAIRQKYNDVNYYQTETECNDGSNTWTQALSTYKKIIDDLGKSMRGYFYWNLILDETEKSHWNWKQNSLITIDRDAKKVTLNPEYYAMKHASWAVPSGSKRLRVTGGSELRHVVAFLDFAGNNIILLENETDESKTPAFLINGRQAEVTVPPHSMNTLIWPGATPAQ